MMTLAILLAMIGLAGLVGIGVAYVADRALRHREMAE